MKLPRFSLRGLLLLTACLAIFCYWRDRPRQVAKRFAAAVEAGDFQAAEAMFTIKDDHFPKLPPASPHWKALPIKSTWQDWLAGRCVVRVSNSLQRNSIACYMHVTATGIRQTGMWHVAPNAR
jgi:hypothetical protein